MYLVILEEPAKRFIRKLDKSDQKRVIRKLKDLETNPKIGKPLTANLASLWSLRIGKYRSIYKIDEIKITVFILEVGHRKNIYD